MPLALMQTRIELLRRSIRRWMPKQPSCCALSRNSSSGWSALVRTLLEMSDLQSVPRTDRIDLAPMAEEVLVDLDAPPAQKRHHAHGDRRENAAHRQRCAAVSGAVQPDRERHQVHRARAALWSFVGRAGRRSGGNPRAGIPVSIAEEYWDSIFQPFFSAWISRAEPRNGRRGLGLALVQEIVRLHGGTQCALNRAQIREQQFW